LGASLDHGTIDGDCSQNSERDGESRLCFPIPLTTKSAKVINGVSKLCRRSFWWDSNLSARVGLQGERLLWLNIQINIFEYSSKDIPAGESNVALYP
jgi:hypothetical protein